MSNTTNSLFEKTKSQNFVAIIIFYLYLSCIIFHFCFAIFFKIINIDLMFYYNIFSSILFTFIFFINRYGFKTAAVTIAALEMNVFFCLSALTLGLDCGFQNILFGLITFIFFSEDISIKSKTLLSCISLVSFVSLQIYNSTTEIVNRFEAGISSTINIAITVFIIVWIISAYAVYEIIRTNLKDESKKSQELLNSVKNMLDKNLFISDGIRQISREFSKTFISNLSLQNTITSSIEEISKGSKENKNQNNHIYNKIHSLSNMLEQLILYMNQIYLNSKCGLSLTEKGYESLESLIEKLNDNMSTSTKLEDSLRELQEKTKEIKEIINIINSIATQTSLLSLNASIEAARAGEAGKGFAIVATEIRNLANQSNNAAEQIKEIIGRIENSVDISIGDMKNVSDVVNDQKNRSNDTIEVFENIKSEINSINVRIDTANKDINEIGVLKNSIVELVDNIAVLLEQTTSSVTEITTSINDQNSSLNEANSMLEKLLKLSNELKVN